jgi:hypothetical protein
MYSSLRFKYQMIHMMSNLKMAQSNSDYVLSEVNIIETKLYIFRIIGCSFLRFKQYISICILGPFYIGRLCELRIVRINVNITLGSISLLFY